MTETEFKQLKEKLNENYRQDMAALERVFALSNGRQPTVDLGDPVPREESRAGMEGLGVGTVSRSGIKTRKYVHKEAWLKKHPEYRR